MRNGKKLLVLLLSVVLLLSGCRPAAEEPVERVFSAGFGSAVLTVPTDSDEPLYIAGYHSGWEITGVLDEQQACALWLDDGVTSAVLIVVDCIGLSRGTVAAIREALADFCSRTGCDSVNVVATHTHAGIDTLGLWGPVAMDGKNSDFMDTLIDGAVRAAEAAYADRSEGSLVYTVTPTQGLQADSREPQVFDNNLYQLRFIPDSREQNEIRLFSFAAHAESLRGDNTLVSRDYPGVVCDMIKKETGADAIYLPGAIGGLIMTPVLTQGDFDPQENLHLTGERIAEYALQEPAESTVLEPAIALSRVEFETELDNTLFIYYQFLGILHDEVRRTLTGTYLVETELTVLKLGEVVLAMLPGEVCPELVEGGGNGEIPRSLRQIARQYGSDQLIVVGLANDEIGYILPPGDYLLDGDLPYFREAEGDHYEETNSVGAACADDLAAAFEQAVQNLLNDDIPIERRKPN